MNELRGMHDLHKRSWSVEKDLDRLYHKAVLARMPDSIMAAIAKNSAQAFGLRRYINRRCDELG